MIIEIKKKIIYFLLIKNFSISFHPKSVTIFTLTK